MIICGTGHRPNKLGGYGYEVHKKLNDLAIHYLSELPDNLEKVISGGALGWDQALAAAALYLKIPYVMALPFEGFEARWPVPSIQYLSSLCEQAAETVYVCEPGYDPWKMQERNRWMVDHADRVLALWNGTDGGTANCVRYAVAKHKPIVNLWDIYNNKDNDGESSTAIYPCK